MRLGAAQRRIAFLGQPASPAVLSLLPRETPGSAPSQWRRSSTPTAPAASLSFAHEYGRSPWTHPDVLQRRLGKRPWRYGSVACGRAIATRVPIALRNKPARTIPRMASAETHVLAALEIG